MVDLYQKLLDASFHFISYRPRSEKEVKDFLAKKLERRKIDDHGMLIKVLDRLRELGYIDDATFTSWWIKQRESHKPKGARLLAWELKAKGISLEIVPQDEVASARRAIAKKLPLWQKLSPLERKKKIYGFLGRRGFDGDTIRHIIDEVARGEVES